MADKSLTDYAFEQITGHPASDGWANYMPHGPLMDSSHAVSVSHILSAVFVMIVITIMAFVARNKYMSEGGGVIPDEKPTIGNMFEVIFDACYDLLEDLMGQKYARQYFPIIGTLAVFILTSNLLGMIPGIAPPTDNLNTNLAMALVVTLTYLFGGFREQGIGYLKHFLGPSLWVFPVMLVIELMENFFIYPVSLALRLTGNITGDHLVIGIFGEQAANIFQSTIGVALPLLLPIPFYFLGIIIAVIQTIIFCVLSAIYIRLSVKGLH